MAIRMKDCKLSFRELDVINKRVEEEKFDEGLVGIERHFLEKRPYEGLFLNMLRNTYQMSSKEEWLKYLKDQQEMLTFQNEEKDKPGIQSLFIILRHLVNLCEEKSDYNYIRGNMFELYFYATMMRNRDSENDSDLVYRGSQLVLNEEQTRFTCVIKKDTEISQFCKSRRCKGKSTADYIELKQKSIRLYECKVSPEGVGCKELGYFSMMLKDLNKKGYDACAYFVISTKSNLDRKKIEKQFEDVPQLSNKIKIIDGRDLIK